MSAPFRTQARHALSALAWLEEIGFGMVWHGKPVALILILVLQLSIMSYRSAALCWYSFNFASVYCTIQVMLTNDINTLLKLQITINTMQNTPQHGNMFIMLKCVVTYIFALIIIFLKSIILHKYTQKCMQISSSAVLEACHSELHLGIWSIPTSTQIKTRRAKRYFPIQQM